MSEMHRYLQTMVQFRTMLNAPEGLKYCCPEDLVLKLGRQPSVKLKSPTRGKPKNCFVNAFNLATDLGFKGYYTEGFFQSVIPIQHAWVTLADGSIYDPTLDDERDPCHYLGVAFTHSFMTRHIKKRLRDFDGAYPSVFTTPDEFYDIDVLKGDFELAELEPS